MTVSFLKQIRVLSPQLQFVFYNYQHEPGIVMLVITIALVTQQTMLQQITTNAIHFKTVRF